MTHPAPAEPAPTPAPPTPTPPPAPPQPPVPQPPTTPPGSTTVTFTGPPGFVPQFVAPTQTATTTNGANAGQAAQPAPQQQPATGSDNPDGYPANTPLAQMTAEEQVAYWKHQARKHEDRVKSMADYDQLRQTADEYQRLVEASQTEHERAVAEARRQGHAEALAAAGGQLVEQWVRAAAAGRLPTESVNALLEGLDRTRFLSRDGGVDTDRVYAFVNSLASVAAPATVLAQQGAPVQPAAPAAAPVVTPTGGPDFGQGHPSSSRPSGLEAGREIARRRLAAQNPTPVRA